MKLSFVLSFGFAIGSFAAPAAKASRDIHTIHEKRDILPPNWSQSAKMPSEAIISMRFALAQSNLHRAEELLMDVSHPKSPNYGKHWTPKQVAETFAPSEETHNVVKHWLEENGISGAKVSQSLGWIHANVTIADAEQLLETDYYLYEHDSGIKHVGCTDYSLPQEVREHIDFVTPTVHFDIKVPNSKERTNKLKKAFVDEKDVEKRQAEKPHVVEAGMAKAMGESKAVTASKDLHLMDIGDITAVTSADLSTCNTHIVPDCLRALYGFTENDAASVAAGNSFGVSEFTPQFYLQSDLDLFFANFSPSLVGTSPPESAIDGGILVTSPLNSDFNAESDLDLQFAMSLVAPQVVTLFQVGDVTAGASFNNFLDAFDASYCAGDDPSEDAEYPDLSGAPNSYTGPETCGTVTQTNVISTSYSFNEIDLTPAYEIRQCNEYAKLGLLGITFIFSSGDGGVGGGADQCIDPTTNLLNDGSSGRFNPSFPGGCPFITSVGATQIDPLDGTVTDPEQATARFPSGGGFSNVFALPSYQTDAMSFYYNNFPPPYTSAQFNNSQTVRGFPDVAANGDLYVVALDGEFVRLGGTSASAPTFASIITLVNQARLNKGLATVGFVNPVLYANPGVLNDIVVGTNPGCGTDGFEAVQGWDPLTGLGTPNFPAMEALWLSLP